MVQRIDKGLSDQDGARLPRLEMGPDESWFREIHKEYVVEHHRHGVIPDGNWFACNYVYGDGAPCNARFYWGAIDYAWQMRIWRPATYEERRASGEYVEPRPHGLP